VSAGRLVGLLAVLPVLAGCSTSVEGTATAVPGDATPESAAELEALIVTDVPSGLPRLPDDELEPPAGLKTVEDVAGYADDPAHERAVLEDYGYRFGWERFWGSGDSSGPVTSVFVYQFDSRAGASEYSRDLAGNDAESYDGVLRDDPPDLPGGCRLVTVPRAGAELPGPAASAWCGSGVFSVGVTAVAGSLAEADAEVAAVLRAQLALLPPG